MTTTYNRDTNLSTIATITKTGNNIENQYDPDTNQPKYPCPCCKYDCENFDCILCNYCNNWFHQTCAKISNKRFNILANSAHLKFKCKFCLNKNKKCSNCTKTINSNSFKKLYCVSCKDWYCKDCLPLSVDQINMYMTSDSPYFCRDCSNDYFCPICSDICRDKCIFCNYCEKFIHLKCSKLSRGQVRTQNQTYMCQGCLKDNLPVDMVSKTEKVTDASNLAYTNTNQRNTNTDVLSHGHLELDNIGCGLCIECNNDCLTCDVCPDMQRVCPLCLSCKNYDTDKLNQLLDSYDQTKNIFVMQINTRSLTLHFEKLETLLLNCDVLPDIIAISETRLNDQLIKEKNLKIPGYKFIYQHSVTGNSDIGGVGMYISKKLKYHLRPDLAFNFEGCETKFIEVISRHQNMRNTIVGVTYRHPHDNHNLFYTKLGNILENIANKYSVILCGDINVDLATPQKSLTKEYKNLLLSFGCANLINKFTRISTDINGVTSKTIIDHMITNLNMSQTKSGVLQYEIADHLPIFSLFSLCHERQRTQTQTKRIYNATGKAKFIEVLTTSVQHMLNNQNYLNNPESCLKHLIKEIQLAEERAFPLKKLSRKKAKALRKSWMTTGILQSMKHRDQLFREQLGKNDENLTRVFRQKRNKVTRIIEKAKDLDMLYSFEKIIDNPKKVWAKINSKILNKTKSGSALPSEIQIGANIIYDKNTIANELNKHFVNKGHTLASNLPASGTYVLDSMKPPTDGQCIVSWRPTQLEEILNIIRDAILKHKSEGNDNIPAVLIKCSAETIAHILVMTFNRFLELGQYPDILKIARVTALHKGGDKVTLDNYRSISVLTHINKIFEKLIYERLNDFVTDYNILEKHQFGFRKGHSTSHGISHLHDTILESIEKKKVCAALFIDLKSAFDTIDHKILENKLFFYGIKGKALKLITSYLTNRKQFIKTDDVMSEVLRVLCGVPQGSVLGPLLFIIYINDMDRCSELNTVLFADDAVLTMSHKFAKQLQFKFNQEVNKLHHWLIANKLTLNLSKTKFMLFSKKRTKKSKEKKFKININKYSIKRVTEMKYLGVILDDKLNWHRHIQFLCSKLSKAAGIIYKVRKKVPKKVLLLLYHSLVATYLRYGIASWGSAKTTALGKLRSLQNKILRYMTYTPQDSDVSGQYIQLNLLTLSDIYFLEISKFMYRNSKSTLPASFDEYFKNIEHQHNTRNKSNSALALPRPRTDLGKQSIKYSGVKIWGEIPLDIRNAQTYETFGTLLKSHLITKMDI